MAIKIRCPNEHCAKILSVKEELAGKKCLCPACGLVFLIPNLGPAVAKTSSSPAAPSRKQLPQEEDIVELEPEPEEEPRRRKRPRRDEEEGERRRNRPASRTEQDEDEDDDDEDPEDRERRKTRARNRELKRAKLGVFLAEIGAWFYVGATGVLLLLALLVICEVHMDSAYFILAGLPGMAHWVLVIIGLSFCVAGPARYGARGLAIATLAVSGLHLLTLFVMAFSKDSIGPGALLVFSGLKWIPFATSLPLLPWLLNPELIKAIDTTWPLLATALLELARWILILLYVRAIGKTVKDPSLGDDAIKQVIVVPSALGVLFVVELIFGLISKSVTSVSAAKAFMYLFKVLFLLNFLAVGLLAVWLAIYFLSARDRLQYRKG
ncbi:MAG: BRcat domain-containing protein [Gemmataceae bacterium]